MATYYNIALLQVKSLIYTNNFFVTRTSIFESNLISSHLPSEKTPSLLETKAT